MNAEEFRLKVRKLAYLLYGTHRNLMLEVGYRKHVIHGTAWPGGLIPPSTMKQHTVEDQKTAGRGFDLNGMLSNILQRRKLGMEM
jgi:hypothetical protein